MTLRSQLDEAGRLELICEAIRYCGRVRGMGMPRAAWTKALREPIYFLWEARHGSKVGAARYRSVASANLSWGTREIVYDHAIPFVLVQDELLDLTELSHDTVRQVLDRMLVSCVITDAESRLLSANGLGRRMPPGWARETGDPLARYRALQIAVEPNPRWALAR